MNAYEQRNMMNDATLEKVVGGDGACGMFSFSGLVDESSAVIGENYYVVFDDEEGWSYGTLTEVCRSNNGIGIRSRYVFQLHEVNGCKVERQEIYKTGSVMLYKNCTVSG